MKKKRKHNNIGRKRGRVRTHIKAGPSLRCHDHIGQFNFVVEIEGVSLG